MMKARILIFCTAVLSFLTAGAQTLNVVQGQVTYAHKAASVGDMTFDNGTELTIEGRTYAISEIGRIVINSNSVADNTISVTYSGTSASVTVAGNLAKAFTATVSGADVTITADPTWTDEVYYTLGGTSTDGSFSMSGKHKATFTLNSLTLTNQRGGAVTIDDGKRIALVLNGASKLADMASGTHNACLYIDGHAEISGTGSLTLAGNTKHAFTSDEYTLLSSGQVTVTSAVGDGFHISQYFKMDGGSLTITAQGDGIDVGMKGVNKGTADQYENNGCVFLNGGTLNVTSTGDTSKGLKADASVTVAGATATITTTGAAVYDATEADISSSSALKPSGDFTMTSGTVTLKSTGAGGKGLNAGGSVAVSGGTLTAVTTGERYKYNSDLDTKPQAVKGSSAITLTGGQVYAAVAASKATTFKTDGTFSVTGATIMGVGGKSVVPTAGTQTYKTYAGVSVAAGSTLSYNGVTFQVPSDYKYTGATILVSSPSM